MKKPNVKTAVVAVKKKPAAPPAPPRRVSQILGIRRVNRTPMRTGECTGPLAKQFARKDTMRVKKVVATTAVDTEKPHAKHSPSTLKNKEICPGWTGRDSGSAASAEGSALHRYMELWGMGARGHRFTAGESKEWNSLKLAHTTEQDDILSQIVSVMCALFAEYRDGTVLFEYELDLSALDLPGCEHGTADVVLVNSSQDRFCIVDYKFGKVEVETPEDNAQFHAYALGGFHKYPKATHGDVICLQPRCNVLGQATFTREQMPELALRLKVIVERAHAIEYKTKSIPNDVGVTAAIVAYQDGGMIPPSLNPQTSLCEYCANVGVCPAVAEFALKITPPQQKPPYVNPEDILTLPESDVDDIPEELGNLASWGKILEAFVKDLNSRLCALAGEGYEIDGFYLVNSSGRKTLIDPLGLAKELKKKFNLSPEQLLTCAQLSTEKIEELIAKCAPVGKKEKAKEDVRALMEGGGYFKNGNGFSYLKKSSK